MRIADRYQGGRELVPKLEKYRDDPNAIVIGLPRGGVLTAYEVAKGLNLPLDIICPRKIGAPMNPEYALGAITETGEGIFNQDVIEQLEVPDDYIARKVEEETIQAKNRLKLYRPNLPPLQLEGKTAIIVDDGLATGSTMRAAIVSAKKEKAAKIVIAIPVSPPHAEERFSDEVDEFICLMTPPGFYAVGQYYEDFAPTTDKDVVEVLKKFYA